MLRKSKRDLFDQCLKNRNLACSIVKTPTVSKPVPKPIGAKPLSPCKNPTILICESTSF